MTKSGSSRSMRSIAWRLSPFLRKSHVVPSGFVVLRSQAPIPATLRSRLAPFASRLIPPRPYISMNVALSFPVTMLATLSIATSLSTPISTKVEMREVHLFLGRFASGS